MIKWIILLKHLFFPLLVIIGNYLRTSNNDRQLIFNINAVVLIDTDNLLRFTKLVKCIPEFKFFYCVLEN